MNFRATKNRGFEFIITTNNIINDQHTNLNNTGYINQTIILNSPKFNINNTYVKQYDNISQPSSPNDNYLNIKQPKVNMNSSLIHNDNDKTVFCDNNMNLTFTKETAKKTQRKKTVEFMDTMRYIKGQDIPDIKIPFKRGRKTNTIDHDFIAQNNIINKVKNSPQVILQLNNEKILNIKDEWSEKMQEVDFIFFGC